MSRLPIISALVMFGAAVAVTWSVNGLSSAPTVPENTSTATTTTTAEPASSSSPTSSTILTTTAPSSTSTVTTASTSSTTTSVPGPIAYDDPTLAPVCGVATGNGCRIIAYYGTPLSTRLGPLGATPPDKMLAALRKETARWQAADPTIPTRCALHLIAVIAQASPGPSGFYRARTAPAVIDKVLGWARSSGCLLLIDIQVGQSSVPEELPHLMPWLTQPDVHLALDPEWDMPPGAKPGSRIGTMTAADINVAVDALHRLVVEQKLPPKMLVVHRFRSFMVTEPNTIKAGNTIRLVANMDGFGPPAQKIGGYQIAREGMPTNLGGFKLFFKNDKPLLGPKDLVPTGVVTPPPVFINYQ